VEDLRPRVADVEDRARAVVEGDPERGHTHRPGGLDHDAGLDGSHAGDLERLAARLRHGLALVDGGSGERAEAGAVAGERLDGPRVFWSTFACALIPSITTAPSCWTTRSMLLAVRATARPSRPRETTSLSAVASVA